MIPINELKKGGFWIRLLATWMDCIIIYMVLTGIFYLLLFTSTYVYFPFNFTFFVVGIIYSATLIALKGRTIGKYLLGLTVENSDGTRLSFFKSILRETVLKILSGVVLFLGFFWIGFSKKKMAWHDYLVKSSVVQNKKHVKNAGMWKIIALSSFLLFFGNYVWNFIGIIVDAKKIEINPSAVRLPFMERNLSTVTDVSSVKDTSFVNWLDKNAQTPEEYAIQIAATHQITMFGEMHENANNLNFFNQIIEPLYYKSGIRVIAMEVIPASMNKQVDKLINGKTYDSSLAMEIARSQSWKMWGFKEYWDVLGTVWKLNKSLPAGAERMRLVGIDCDINMPNVSLLGLSHGDSKGTPAFAEKFRVFSAIEDIPYLIYRDKIMAGNIEKEIIDKHQKAVVLIGYNHTMINFTNSAVKNKKIESINPRFGVLLSQKYKNTFFQVELYQRLDFNEGNTVCSDPSIDNLLDSVMRQRANKPAGFTIAGSPFEKLRDNCSPFFSQFPSVCYGDIAQGLIFLKPFNVRNKCKWLPGYISNEMFMKYKPLYDLITSDKVRFKNAEEVNQAFSENN